MKQKTDTELTQTTEAMQSLRKEIDRLDTELLRLVNERARLARKIGEYKHTVRENNVYRPEREAQIITRMQNENPGPLADAVVADVFRELMSACRDLQSPLRIAYLGPPGTFTHAAVNKHFGQAVEDVSQSSIDEVFRQVAAGSCHYGVVPIENSTEGVVNSTLDMFIHMPLLICGEIHLPVHQCLLGTVTGLQQIRCLYSHQQSFAQCHHWLEEHLPAVDRIVVNSNAEAARRVKNDTGSAAIAGHVAARLYDLPILAENIEDSPDNTTRFLIVGKQQVASSGKDKTSIMFAAKNKPGALCQLLQCLSDHGLDMSYIESRPSRQGIWEYVFFVDVYGHREDQKVCAALEDLAEDAGLLRVLGSYPQAQ